MINTIVSSDGYVQITGETTLVKDGVLVANTFFAVPPFQVIASTPPSRWATHVNSLWVDQSPPVSSADIIQKILAIEAPTGIDRRQREYLLANLTDLGLKAALTIVNNSIIALRTQMIGLS